MAISTIGQNGLNAPLTLTSPVINTITSASGSALTLQSNGGTTAITIDTSQNVLLGTSVIPSGSTKSIILGANSYIDWGQGDCRIADSSGAMQFYTFTTGSFSERFRILGTGDFKAASYVSAPSTLYGAQFIRTWCTFGNTGNIFTSYGISSVSVVGSYTYQVNFSTAAPHASYAILGWNQEYGAGWYDTPATTYVVVHSVNFSANPIQPIYYSFMTVY